MDLQKPDLESDCQAKIPNPKSHIKRRCERNRKRSQRRAIHCPIHGCYLDSASQKHSLFAHTAQQLQSRGRSRLSASLIVTTHATVPLEGEWLEAFWCDECQDITWYHVCKQERTYHLAPAPRHLWQQASGVIDPKGNPSVGEFTKRHACGSGGIKDFRGTARI